MKTEANDPIIHSINPLTKREYFAGLAMQGIRANNYFRMTPDEAAKSAVDEADALINALNEATGK